MPTLKPLKINELHLSSHHSAIILLENSESWQSCGCQLTPTIYPNTLGHDTHICPRFSGKQWITKTYWHNQINNQNLLANTFLIRLNTEGLEKAMLLLFWEKKSWTWDFGSWSVIRIGNGDRIMEWTEETVKHLAGQRQACCFFALKMTKRVQTDGKHHTENYSIWRPGTKC